MNEALNLLLLSLLGSVAGLIGGIVFLFSEKLAGILERVALPFAAGVLISISLLDLLPEAFEKAPQMAPFIILIVFLSIFLIERFLLPLHHHDGEKPHKGIVPLVIIGDTIHNFLDGVAIAAAFMVNPTFGLFVALGTFLHETPHEIADFGILLSAGWKKTKVFWANFASAAFTVPGAFLTFYFAEKIEAGTGLMLSIAAGLFLYISSTDFLPSLGHHHDRGKEHWQEAFFIILGVVAVGFLRILVPEVH